MRHEKELHIDTHKRRMDLRVHHLYGDKDAQQHGCDYEQNLSGINFSHVICF